MTILFLKIWILFFKNMIKQSKSYFLNPWKRPRVFFPIVHQKKSEKYENSINVLTDSTKCESLVLYKYSTYT